TKESYLVSASAGGRHLVLAYKTKFVMVEANENEGEYAATGQGSGCESAGEIYVMVGYNTGWLRIFSELRTPPPIFKVSFQKDINEEDEEITLLFESNKVVSIDGHSLWTALRASDRDGTSDGSRSFTYKKWEFQQQEGIRDVHPLVDQHSSLSTRVFCTPATARFVAVGNQPMLSFYSTRESTRPLMSAVSMASYMVSRVATPVFSFAKSWWGGSQGGGGSTATSNASSRSGSPSPYQDAATLAASIEPATPIQSSVSFADPYRRITQISLSPAYSSSQRHRLAVTSDVLGRVILWDVVEAEMIRMWKGVRDATCGWLEVFEGDLANSTGRQMKSGPARILLFLVIYSSRRGLLKVFQMRHGRQVGVFHLGPDWHLVPCGGEPLGSSMVSIERRRMAMQDGEGECGELSKCLLIGPGGEVRNVGMMMKYT
ncbi:Rab3 GTPase-activating protein regulatory subunit N-terminus-domain-containing protein, partial [Phycomyces blakesleeanus]